MKKHIPNLLTCGNLACGCIGIDLAYQGNLVWAAYMIGFAAIFDFLDGFVARLLKVSSPIGKELDSLADMVTFGVLPGMMMLQMLQNTSLEIPVIYLAFLIPIFSALRLAKFNVDTRQSDSFLGVPTPANAIFIGSFPLVQKFAPQYSYLIENQLLLIIVTIVMSLLLVIEIRLIALKFKDYSWINNVFRYIFIASAIILAVALQYLAIPLIIMMYILLSIIEQTFTLNNR